MVLLILGTPGRLAGGKRCSACDLQRFINSLSERVRGPEDAPRGPFRVLKRRHGLAQIVERGGVVVRATNVFFRMLSTSMLRPAKEGGWPGAVATACPAPGPIPGPTLLTPRPGLRLARRRRRLLARLKPGIAPRTRRVIARATKCSRAFEGALASPMQRLSQLGQSKRSAATGRCPDKPQEQPHSSSRPLRPSQQRLARARRRCSLGQPPPPIPS